MEPKIDTTQLKAKHDALNRGDVKRICADLKITRQTYYNVIEGRNIKVSTLCAICARLGVDPATVLQLPSSV